MSTMLLLIHLLSNIVVNYFRSIHPLLGSPFHKRVVVQINGVVSGENQTKLWSMRSSTHLNCLWHGKQLFASFVPNSTRWLFFCLYLLCVLLLLVFVAKDLQQLLFGRDSVLELAKVHDGKASARLPSKQC